MTDATIDQHGNIPQLFLIDDHIITQNLRIFGYKPGEDDSLDAYRVATGKYLEDPEVKQCVVWMKHDYMKLGKLRIGHQPPNCTLHYLGSSSPSTSSSSSSPSLLTTAQKPLFIGDERPMVLIGGSYT